MQHVLKPLSCFLQRMCRRLLALYSLPSWGRCELVLSLLQEPGVTYSLEDVVQAVKESHDRDFIRRLLNNECPTCFGIFPRGKVGGRGGGWSGRGGPVPPPHTAAEAALFPPPCSRCSP